MKRAFDLVAAGVGLMVLAPLLAGLALAVKATSPGPVLYCAVRTGRDGVPFRLYKFRSMSVGADRCGPGITVSGDSRVTRLGRWLRRTKLDELPQLLNVLKGDMSLVGPRPEDPRYVALYSAEQRRILAVRPGITSVASLEYRQEAGLLSGGNWEQVYCATIMPQKLAIDLAYIEQQSLGGDIAIILRTLASLLP